MDGCRLRGEAERALKRSAEEGGGRCLHSCEVTNTGKEEDEEWERPGCLEKDWLEDYADIREDQARAHLRRSSKPRHLSSLLAL